MVEKGYDFVILGAGVTGLAAAMYSARLGLKTLVLGTSHGSEMPVGGVITTTNLVENYPGFISVPGPVLAKRIENHAKDYDIHILNSRVEDIKLNEKDVKKAISRLSFGRACSNDSMIDAIFKFSFLKKYISKKNLINSLVD